MEMGLGGYLRCFFFLLRRVVSRLTINAYGLGTLLGKNINLETNRDTINVGGTMPLQSYFGRHWALLLLEAALH